MIGLVQAVRSDIRQLSEMVRDSAGEGELQAAGYVAERLREVGVGEVEVQSYRGRKTYAPSHAIHTAIGVALAVRRGFAARLGSLALLASLELDAGGRFPWLARILPRGEGANVIARIPAREGTERVKTVVLLAHHDAARTGLVWSPAISRVGKARRIESRRIEGFMLPVAAGFALASIPLKASRLLGAGLLGLATALTTEVGLGETVPGASDNASGVAGLIELAGQITKYPLPGVEVQVWSVGSEESGMDGMRAALSANPLDPDSTFILGLDTLGAGKPILAASEGTILEHRYANEDMDLVDRAADAAGLGRPERWRIGGWTDPILGVFAGIPTVSLLSIGPEGLFTNYHLPTDTADNVNYESVEDCIKLARATIDALAES